MVDVPANTSTTAGISVGGTVTGSLEVAGDHDWYRITLTAGQSITISLSGVGTTPVTDTYLYLHDASGNVLTSNDDSGGGLDSKIVFTATTSGTYFIDAGAYDDAYAGTYAISVQPYAPPPVWTYDQIANQLVSGYWTAQGDSARHFNVHQGGAISVNITGLTAAGQTLAIAALGEWSDLIGVNFTQVTSGGQITFDDNADGAFTSDVTSGAFVTSARVNISTQWLTDYGTGLNSYSFQAYLHEIGHALGLGHGGNYNDTADYATDALYSNDAWSTTIMSYFDQQDNSYFAGQGFTREFVLTPMIADVVAMQSMYGLSTATRTGNTTYGFNSNADRSIFNALQFPNVGYTIFDSGGIDTMDYSGFSNDQLINLNPETFSNVGSSIGNVSIGRTVIIENAVGGGGNDTLIGNNAANTLSGGAGADTLQGGAGDDFLTGGGGPDQLTGGAGSDTFVDNAAGHNGDRIVDFSAGDKIVFVDAALSGFTFNLSGNSLTYSGGALTFGSAVGGTIVASAAAGGGVQLTIGTNTVARHASDDFNGDGRSDVLWRNDNGDVTNWLGQANGGFIGNTANAYNNASTSWHIVGTGDFNGDGRADVLWRNDNGHVTDWLGQASGGFAGNIANADSNVDSSWHVVGTGDFNGDGRDDILWRKDNGDVTNWLGQANGGFVGNTANAYNNANTSWHVVGTGDFNGDGRDDILWRNDNGNVTNWLGQANGGFVGNIANANNNAAISWHVAGTGDFNGDGRDDILWRSDDGTVTDWLGQANGGFAGNAANAFSNAATSWHILGIGDFNGDGRDDVLWRNDDGTVTDWLGQANGGFVGNIANSHSDVASSWHVQPQETLF